MIINNSYAVARPNVKIYDPEHSGVPDVTPFFSRYDSIFLCIFTVFIVDKNVMRLRVGESAH